MESKQSREARAALLEKVGGRVRPDVYIVQLSDFKVKPVRGENGQKVVKLQGVNGSRILRILAGPVYFGTPKEQARAMEIALANKNRWPAETVGEEPISLGGCDSDYGKPREATPYDDDPGDAEAWD